MKGIPNIISCKTVVRDRQNGFFAAFRTSFFLLLILLLAVPAFAQKQIRKIDPQEVTIIRDKWGTPHIFAPTNPGAAYGLAWANCEDFFEIVQEALLTAKGMMARTKGREGAAIDFFVKTIRAREIVEEQYGEVSPEFIEYLWGYCQAANTFAKLHPDRVLDKKAFPVNPKDVITAFVVSFAALTGVAGDVERAVTGRMDERLQELMQRAGSNAFALAAGRSTAGETYLCINPHFRVEGIFSFYEAHLMTEEGMNVAGASFQGGPCVFMGTNENLGWGMTWNHFDAVDTYALKMHPKKKNRYRFDGEWRKLEKRPIWLNVRIGKHLVVPVRRMTWQSVHGPVVKSDKGDFYYAIRSGPMMTAKPAEEFWKMDLAKNFEEFKDAVAMEGIGKFNIIYADKNDNIFYLSNGLIPDRNLDFYDSNLMRGDTSAALWQRWFPWDELPQVTNPGCGWVLNTNNTPFRATCDGQNDDPDRLPKYVDTRGGNNNRADRLQELIESRDKHSYADFKAMKFDYTYPKTSNFLTSLEPLFNLDSTRHPEIAPSIRMIHAWDHVADPESPEATLFELTIDYVFKKKGYGDDHFVSGLFDVEEALFAEAVKASQEHLLKYFGTVRVPLKDFHRYYCDGKDFECRGYPDVLMASYGWKQKDDGHYKIRYGDTYIQFARFNEDGTQEVESLLPFARFRGEWESQLDLYNRLETKPMPLTREGVEKIGVRTYHPGE